MDDTTNDPIGIPRVPRKAEPTRLEGQLLTTAYERVLPLQRHPLDSRLASRGGSGRRGSDSRSQQLAAAGA